MHKILVHSPEVINNVLFPIRQLSEEVQEARNKDFKKYREGFSRKFSRLKTNEDVLHLLLISSDPDISSIRPLPSKKLRKLSDEIICMLQSSEIVNNLGEVPENSEDSETNSEDKSY